MIPLHGRLEPLRLNDTIERGVWRIAASEEPPDERPLARLVGAGTDVPDGYGLYLTTDPERLGPATTLRLPAQLAHLVPGDVIRVSEDGTRAQVLWKEEAQHNALLLTEQCDNYCLMCSQPPKEVDDAWLYEQAKQVIGLLTPGVRSLGLTGGEPTLNEEALLGLLRHCADVAPWLQLHLLSNGRRFSDLGFTRRYAAIDHRDLMVGIPLYAAESALHDYVVQARGAFDETVRGILSLSAHGQRVELRMVLQKHTVPTLAEFADFVARNLPFVDQVALMALEVTGLARPNAAEVWIDPTEYQDELAAATYRLAASRVPVRIYNHPLCLLRGDLWPFAVRSISDWKNDYLPVCEPCAVRDACCGVFTTSRHHSPHLRSLSDDELVPTGA